LSTKGIYTALSGARAQAQRLDTIANNIANVDTTGFKKDTQVFKEYLTAHQKNSDVIETPKVPASVESFYDLKGGDKGYVDNDGTFTNFKQGALKPTGGSLDFALEGRGFFQVATPAGVRMTRNGSFGINGEGVLVSKEGHPVLAAGNPQAPPEQRVIRVQDRNINVALDGQVTQAGEVIGRLALVNIENEEALRKVGNSMYKVKENYVPQINMQPEVHVKQGFLEKSNVNIVEEMTRMIGATRTFEANQRAMKAYDQMNNKLVNDVPNINF
jgi:flagellar basal-body rod protein FlgF